MRLVAPAERGMNNARRLAVIGKGTAPGQQTRVLGALDARADDFRPGVDFGRVVHSPTTARIALTMCS